MEEAERGIPPPVPQLSEDEVRERLEASRKELQSLVLRYKDHLQKTELASNRTVADSRDRQQLLHGLNDSAGKLDFLNAGEGLMTLCISSLHSILLLKDEVNDLKFQNAVLNKKIKNIESEK